MLVRSVHLRQFFLTAICLSVSGVTQAAPTTGSASQLTAVRVAIIAGRLDQATRLLAQISSVSVDRNELDFLRGTVALDRHDWDGAIADFHAVLDRDPGANRVRLDLARAFFEKGDDVAAEHHFRIAEAAGLPPAVQANVDRFLSAIEHRKKWSVDASFGIAPDTNTNQSTGAQSVTIYGLPFNLNQNARQHSGIGVTAGLGGTYQYTLEPNARFVLGATDSEVDYSDHAFDDRTISAVAGPRFLIGDTAEISFLGVADRRWYGEKPLDWGTGGRAEGQWAATPRLLISGAAEAEQVTYTQADDSLSGPRISLSVSATYGLNAVSSIKLDGAIMREQTTDSAFSDFQYITGLSYFRDLPWGFSINLGGTTDFARYDTQMAAFGKTLRYDQIAWKLGLSNRHISLLGFSPVVTFTHTEQLANIPLYRYSRDQGEIGVTRTF